MATTQKLLVKTLDHLLHLMGWQTTFTLSKRAKGCYLVTDEVVRAIQPGLQGVSVRGTFLSSTVVGSDQFLHRQECCSFSCSSWVAPSIPILTMNFYMAFPLTGIKSTHFSRFDDQWKLR